MFPFQNYKLYRTNSVDSEVSPQKNLIILLNQPMTKSEEDLLQKILQSINVSMDQAEIIVFDENSDYNNGVLLGFGVDSDNLYELVRSPGQTELYADSLRDINDSVDLKKKLWAQLKLLDS